MSPTEPQASAAEEGRKGWSLQRQLIATFVLGSAALIVSGVVSATLVAYIGLANGTIGTQWLLLIAAAIAGVITTIFAIALWLSLHRWVIWPLKTLGGQTHLVAQGQLDREVKLDGPRELVRVAQDVEAMRTYLVAALTSALQSREVLRSQTQQLEEQAANLRRSNSELEQFAYVASHDLQEPLRKVASFCQMLQRRYGGQLDERADQYISFAVDGAKRMQRLINDLLAFSRVGRTTGEFVPVDLNAALAIATESLQNAVDEAEARIEVEPLPTVSGNPTLLAQVLQNLLGNAIKFRGEKPPHIAISVKKTKLENPEGQLSPDAAATDMWEFSCQDNGIGIEPQYADRIFVIFQRLHTTQEYAGTGIGLALCRKIIEHHGGRMWLDTTSSAGTTMKWSLPVLAEEPLSSISQNGPSRD